MLLDETFSAEGASDNKHLRVFIMVSYLLFFRVTFCTDKTPTAYVHGLYISRTLSYCIAFVFRVSSSLP